MARTRPRRVIAAPREVEYLEVEDDPKRLPEPPRLPQRAAIYIAPDGSVHFGALFEGLLPVARALGRRNEGPNPSDAGEKNESA